MSGNRTEVVRRADFPLLSFPVVCLYSLYFHLYVNIKGYHIHHFYFGTLALALDGILGLLSDSDHGMRIFSPAPSSAPASVCSPMKFNCTTSRGLYSHVFSDSGDIILTIACSIVFLIAITDTDIKALVQKCSSLRSVLSRR